MKIEYGGGAYTDSYIPNRSKSWSMLHVRSIEPSRVGISGRLDRYILEEERIVAALPSHVAKRTNWIFEVENT